MHMHFARNIYAFGIKYLCIPAYCITTRNVTEGFAASAIDEKESRREIRKIFERCEKEITDARTKDMPTQNRVGMPPRQLAHISDGLQRIEYFSG